MTRILVAANSAITRAGLQALVRTDTRFDLVGENYRWGDLVSAAREHAPDVVLLDPGDNPLPRSLPSYPAVVTLVLLVANVTRAEVRHLLQAGIRSLLLRDSAPQEITAALDAAAAGLAVISPEILDVLLPTQTDIGTLADSTPSESLTARESEILSLLAEGTGNKEIASRLHISEHTVKFHVSSILGKLGAATRTEAVTRGYKEGLIVM